MSMLFHNMGNTGKLVHAAAVNPFSKTSNNRGEGREMANTIYVINVRRGRSLTFLSCANYLCQIKSPVKGIHFRNGMFYGSLVIEKSR